MLSPSLLFSFALPFSLLFPRRLDVVTDYRDVHPDGCSQFSVVTGVHPHCVDGCKLTYPLSDTSHPDRATLNRFDISNKGFA